MRLARVRPPLPDPRAMRACDPLLGCVPALIFVASDTEWYTTALVNTIPLRTCTAAVHVLVLFLPSRRLCCSLFL